MLEPKFHVSNSKNKDLLYNCILDKPIHSIDPWTSCSWVRSKRVKSAPSETVLTNCVDFWTAHGAIFIKQNLRYVLTYDLTCNPNSALPLFITKDKITCMYLYLYILYLLSTFYWKFHFLDIWKSTRL